MLEEDRNRRLRSNQLDARYLAISFCRAVLIAVILFGCLAVAMAVGMALADAGYLGTCQDGSCQLAAAIIIMPLGGVALYVVTLVVWSVVTVRNRG